MAIGLQSLELCARMDLRVSTADIGDRSSEESRLHKGSQNVSTADIGDRSSEVKNGKFQHCTSVSTADIGDRSSESM